MRLQNFYFISISTMSQLENSRHSFVGKAAKVRWAIGSFRKYLGGSKCMVLSDCSGLKNSLIKRLM